MFELTDRERSAWSRDGCFVVPGLFDDEEVALLAEVARAELWTGPDALERHDQEGRTTHLLLRNELSDDVFSATVRSRRIARTMAELLGDEVYHYHHKVMRKDPEQGGAWEWHQDYGYWYANGCLWPDLASCMVALNQHTRANGCLQIVPGTHRIGRIDHGTVGDQTGANLERVEQILKRLPVVHCELAPGDALFFHANVLHRSDRNASSGPRLTLIDCYNTKRNDPCKQHHHPNYAPLEVWPDERVKEVGRRQVAELAGRGPARHTRQAPPHS